MSTKNVGFGLNVRVNDGRRHIVGGKQDNVTKTLNSCSTVADIAKAAPRFGVPASEVRERAKTAPNFGQLRMVVGNRMRGEMSRKTRSSAHGRNRR